MSIILNNKDLIKHCKEENEINKENIVEYFMTFVNNKGKIEYMEEEIEFIGKNFEELRELFNNIKD